MYIILLVLLFSVTPNTAYAYLDPISVSYIFTIIITLIAFILSKIKKFYLYFNYDNKFHLINLLFIITPLIQFISLNISGVVLIFYKFLIILNIIFILVYFLLYKILKKYFLKEYKNILFLFVVLFFFQFQFYDLYLLSTKADLRLSIIAVIFVVPFLIIFFLKKNFVKNLFSNFIFAFFLFFIFKFLQGSYLNYVEIKDLKAKFKLEKNNNLKNKNELSNNIYFIISDAVVDLDLFENKYSKFLNKKIITNNFKSNFDKEGLQIIVNSEIQFKDKSTRQSLGSIININDNLPRNGSKYKYQYPIAMKFFNYSTLRKKLNEKNLNFFWIGNIWNNCNLYNTSLCFDNQTYNKNFYHFRTLDYYLEASYFGNIIFKIFKEKFHYNEIHKSNSTLTNFINNSYSKNLDLINKKNNFFLIHDYGAHPPFIYDQECNYNFYQYDSKEGYANSYVCNLKELLSFIKFINHKDPDSFIIVTGDHGYFQNRNNILRMIKMNNCDYDKTKISQDFSYLVSRVISCSSSL